MEGRDVNGMMGTGLGVSIPQLPSFSGWWCFQFIQIDIESWVLWMPEIDTSTQCQMHGEMRIPSWICKMHAGKIRIYIIIHRCHHEKCSWSSIHFISDREMLTYGFSGGAVLGWPRSGWSNLKKKCGVIVWFTFFLATSAVKRLLQSPNAIRGVNFRWSLGNTLFHWNLFSSLWVVTLW